MLLLLLLLLFLFLSLLWSLLLLLLLLLYPPLACLVVVSPLGVWYSYIATRVPYQGGIMITLYPPLAIPWYSSIAILECSSTYLSTK